MAGKARLFGDAEAERRAVDAVHPKAAKAAGRSVRGFDDAVWERERFALVTEGSMHKFAQHPALRDFLLGTGRRVLVEASPLDRVWGIGLAADDERAEHPARLARPEPARLRPHGGQGATGGGHDRGIVPDGAPPPRYGRRQRPATERHPQDMTERLVVIGGDATGMSAASQARRRRPAEDLEIVAYERGRHVVLQRVRHPVLDRRRHRGSRRAGRPYRRGAQGARHRRTPRHRGHRDRPGRRPGAHPRRRRARGVGRVRPPGHRHGRRPGTAAGPRHRRARRLRRPDPGRRRGGAARPRPRRSTAGGGGRRRLHRRRDGRGDAAPRPRRHPGRPRRAAHEHPRPRHGAAGARGPGRARRHRRLRRRRP